MKFSFGTLVVTYDPRVGAHDHYQRKMASLVQQVHRSPIPWPSVSPDLTPCYFYLWGYVEKQADRPPIPQSFRELREGISQARANVEGSHGKNSNIALTCATNGAHIKHL
jgi:hypothetical protein